MPNDFAKLQHWMALLRSNEVLMGQLSRRMAGVTLALIAQGFEAEQDPYGVRWAPKKRRDGRKILRGRTSRLRLGWHAQHHGARHFLILPSVDYAAAHQAPRYGRRPARRMVPSGSVIPRAWRLVLSRAALAAMRSHYTALI